MSGLSPRRIRTKTSDLSDFFRGSTSHGQQSRQTESQLHLPVPHPTLPDSPTQEPSVGLKKIATRIPFLGRSRKKSTNSTSGASSSGRGYDSTEVTESPSSTKNRRLSHPVSLSPPENKFQPPPLPTALPLIDVSSPSLGSKFAAHFTPSKSRKLSPRPAKASPSEASIPGMLSPPVSPRGASFDSTSSGGSATRSPTPRAVIHPTITVSLSPDNIDDYKDLFTLPRKKLPTQKRAPSTPASEYRDNFHDGDSNITLSPTPPTSPRMQFPNPPSSSWMAGTRRSESTHRNSQGSVDDTISKIPKTRLPSVNRQSHKIEHPVEDLSRISRNTHLPEPGPVIDISPPSPVILKSSPSIHRPRLRTPTTDKPSLPPTIPLPEPPKSPSLPSSPYSSTQPLPGPAVVQRRRAHTIGTVPPSSKPPSPIPAQKRVSDTVKPNSNQEKLNLDSATMEELKEALLTRNREYDELASYLLNLTATHVSEKKALEKKISNLEKENLKKDNELKGFAFIVNNSSHGGKPSNQNQVAYRQSSAISPPKGFRMIHSADDSGAESHQTSGAESITESFRGSTASRPESTLSMRIKRSVKSTTLPDPGFHLSRTPSTKSTRGLGIDSVIPEMPLRSSLSQRSSVYSLSSSSTSSASSLLPPSPSGTTLSSLSAIPESPSYFSSPHKPARVSGSLSAGEADNQRYSSRTSRRISTPALPAQATSAYSANLKRGRPPSIAQVLEKSPLAQEVLDARRLTAGTPRIPSS